MNKANNKEEICPLQIVISTITRKWFILVLNYIGNNRKVNFNKILNNLSGISPKALSDILKEMEAMKLVKKVILKTSPPRVEYSLTSEGKKLRKANMPLFRWAAKYTGHYDCPILVTENKAIRDDKTKTIF